MKKLTLEERNKIDQKLREQLRPQGIRPSLPVRKENRKQRRAREAKT